MKPLKLLCLVLPLTLIAAGFKGEPEKANELNKSLLQAAAEGNIEQVKSLLSKGADVNARDERGLTTLHHAASHGHKDIFDLLIAKGADTNSKDKWGYTPLYYAIWNEDKDMVRLLVAKGADVNVLPNDDGTPLEYAVWNEDMEMAKLFVDRGAKFNVKDNDGWTAFRYAVSGANRELVGLFVEKGADVSSFHGAACLGDLDRVKSFVQRGTDIDTKDEMDWTALYWAASMGQEDVAEFLIARGADVDARAEDSSTALHQASRAGSVKLVKLLIAKGADVNAKAKNGNAPLHISALAGHREVVKLLIAKGANVDAKGRNGWAPLHNAARQGRRHVVELLLAKGADVNAKDNRGRTPLWWANRRGHKEIVEMLLSNKADISAALFSAAQSGDKKFVERLLDLGADVNSQDNLGLTPLHVAASRQDKEIVTLLLAHDAKVNVKDKAERTPLHYAVGARHPWWEPKDGDIEAARLLLNHGADINTPDKEGKTPLYYSVRLGEKMTGLLLDRGADANFVDPRGDKPLPPEHGYTFYVATDGDDSSFGTREHPFKTVNTAIVAARSGDTIYVRGGTYRYSHTVLVEKSGKQDKPIRISAYPGEKPVFDFSTAPGVGFIIRGAYWHIKGIIVTNSGNEGIHLVGEEAHHNILEQITVHSCGRTGICLTSKASQNLILNCDAYRNFDFLGNGQNADGLALAFSVGLNNVLIGNRSWNNADDGYDLWHAGNSVRLESCYAWRNGENLWSHPFFTGNANGFKLGQMEGAHVLIRCVAWDHPMRGFDLNGNSTGVNLYNCTAFRNNINFAFMFSKGNIEKNVLRSNLSYKGLIQIRPEVDDQFNSWNIPPRVEITDDDLLGLDDSLITGRRNPDGSLPENDFLRLAPGSGAIDAGTDVGLPFVGKAPDLGAFECRPAAAGKRGPKMLHQAVRDRDIKQIHALFSKGNGVNEKDWLGYTALHWAVYFGYTDIAEILISEGANPNVLSETGRTPLEIATEMGYERIVELLRRHGAME
jgi:ankyrin repeat protein